MHLGENFAVEMLGKEQHYVIDFDTPSATTNRPEYDLCGSRQTLLIRVPRFTSAMWNRGFAIVAGRHIMYVPSRYTIWRCWTTRSIHTLEMANVEFAISSCRSYGDLQSYSCAHSFFSFIVVSWSVEIQKGVQLVKLLDKKLLWIILRADTSSYFHFSNLSFNKMACRKIVFNQ